MQTCTEYIFPFSAGPRPCDAAKQEAMQFVSEVEQLIRASNASHFPFGQSFLMAKGVRLTDNELLNISPLGTQVSEKLLTGSNYAIQLAAQSSTFFWFFFGGQFLYTL